MPRIPTNQDIGGFVNNLITKVVPNSAEKAGIKYGQMGTKMEAARQSGDVAGYNEALSAINSRDGLSKGIDMAARPARYFTPRNAEGKIDYATAGIRAGATAGASFLAGSTFRTLGGEGSPFSDQRGNFDIAGIPFL